MKSIANVKSQLAVAAKKRARAGAAAKLRLPPVITGSAVASMMVNDAQQAASTGRISVDDVTKLMHRAVMQRTGAAPTELKASDVADMIARAKKRQPGAKPDVATTEAFAHIRENFGDKLDADAAKLFTLIEKADGAALGGGKINKAMVDALRGPGKATPARAALLAYVRSQHVSAFTPDALESLDTSLTVWSSALSDSMLENSRRQTDMMAEEARRSLERDIIGDRRDEQSDHKLELRDDVKDLRFNVGTERVELKEAGSELRVGRDEQVEAKTEHAVGEAKVKGAAFNQAASIDSAFRGQNATSQNRAAQSTPASAKAANAPATQGQQGGGAVPQLATRPWESAMLSVLFPSLPSKAQ